MGLEVAMPLILQWTIEVIVLFWSVEGRSASIVGVSYKLSVFCHKEQPDFCNYIILYLVYGRLAIRKPQARMVKMLWFHSLHSVPELPQMHFSCL